MLRGKKSPNACPILKWSRWLKSFVPYWSASAQIVVHPNRYILQGGSCQTSSKDEVRTVGRDQGKVFNGNPKRFWGPFSNSFFFFGRVREGSYCLAEPVARDFFVVSFLEVNDSCYKRYSEEAFLRDVSNIPWSVIEGARDADDAVYLWESLFKGGADDHAPMKAKRVNPFTPKSDQCQISSAASPVILHRTVWGIWLFIAYSDERWLYYQFSLPHQYISL